MNRRDFLAGFTAAAICQTAAAVPAQMRLPRAALLDVWVRLAGATDEKLAIWWMDGLRYGVIAGRSSLLYGMQVGIFQKFFSAARRHLEDRHVRADLLHEP